MPANEHFGNKGMAAQPSDLYVWRPQLYPVPGYPVGRLYIMLARLLLQMPGWRGTVEPVIVDAAADEERDIADTSR